MRYTRRVNPRNKVKINSETCQDFTVLFIIFRMRISIVHRAQNKTSYLLEILKEDRREHKTDYKDKFGD